MAFAGSGVEFGGDIVQDSGAGVADLMRKRHGIHVHQPLPHPTGFGVAVAFEERAYKSGYRLLRVERKKLEHSRIERGR